MVLSSTILLLFTIGTLIVVLALLILFHHNLNATKGYKLRSHEFTRSQLLLQYERLSNQIAIAQALTTLQQDGKIRQMVAVSKAKYIKGETSIARAEGQEEVVSE